MKKTLIVILLVLVLLAALAGVAYAATGITDPKILADLAKVRQATAKYHDVNVAIADGYVPTDACDAIPGVGGMGYHYFNPVSGDRFPGKSDHSRNSHVRPSSGEGLRLVGVEYFVGVGAPDAPVPNPAPSAPMLFGLPFDGPMPGSYTGMPPHYDLHVWIWRPNPQRDVRDVESESHLPLITIIGELTGSGRAMSNHY